MSLSNWFKKKELISILGMSLTQENIDESLRKIATEFHEVAEYQAQFLGLQTKQEAKRYTGTYAVTLIMTKYEDPVIIAIGKMKRVLEAELKSRKAKFWLVRNLAKELGFNVESSIESYVVSSLDINQIAIRFR